jgi:hypothetical protein
MVEGAAMVTDDQLRVWAQVVANMTKNELRNTGTCHGILAVVHDAHVMRMRDMERTICKLAGEDWLNSNQAKAAVFEVVRMATAQDPPDAVCFSCVINDYEETEAFRALPEAEKIRIMKRASGADLVRQGWSVGPFDAVMANVQTPERVCIYIQRYDPKERMFLGEPRVHCMPQEDMSGRMKAWG